MKIRFPSHRYPDGTEVMYRCAYMKSKPKNSRYKLTCEDGQWVGAVHNLTCGS